MWVTVSFGKIEFMFDTLYVHCISKLQFEVPAVVTYKALKLEKDKGISTLQAEKSFVWDQLKMMEQDYSGTIKKSKLLKQHKSFCKIDELQVVVQKKYGEIIRLQVEVTNDKNRMLILEDELQIDLFFCCGLGQLAC
jgi:hypothetical protein